MDLYELISDFFKMIESNIDKIISILDIPDFKNLLNYLYNCIPSEILTVFMMIILFFMAIRFYNAIRN